MSNKMELLFEELKGQYDYIIVDTAPISLVSDTLIVAKYSDVFIYVMRANFLSKHSLSMIEEFHTEKKLSNMSVVLNDTIWRKSYGYTRYGGYGGYGGYGRYGGYGYERDDENEKKSLGISNIINK